MSAVNEAVVREYFEALGFMVSQAQNYVGPGKRSRVGDGIDFLLVHPGVKDQKLPAHQEWTTRDLSGVSRAVVFLRGWHSSRFTESTFRNAPDILSFVESDVRRFATRALGSGSFAKILCLSGLPTEQAEKESVLNLIHAKGIDGVVLFRTMLLDLIKEVDENRNYEKSDLLQTIRILKRHDLLKAPQMEFLENSRRRKTKGSSGPDGVPADGVPETVVKGML